MKRKRKRKVNSKTKKHSSMKQWERERERELTWPPTTAMAGRESQRVGNALASPWSPRAVQALWILLTSEIKFSIYLRSEYRSDSDPPDRGRSEKAMHRLVERDRVRDMKRVEYYWISILFRILVVREKRIWNLKSACESEKRPASC